MGDFGQIEGGNQPRIFFRDPLQHFLALYIFLDLLQRVPCSVFFRCTYIEEVNFLHVRQNPEMSSTWRKFELTRRKFAPRWRKFDSDGESRQAR